MSSKERPILFSTLMVQAILAGRKTQTRRIVKPQPDEDGIWDHAKFPMNIEDDPGFRGFTEDGDHVEWKCQYGKPKDILWVRESFRYSEISNTIIFKADWRGKDGPHVNRWKPGIHMPKIICRIRLLIESISTERLWDISEKDAQAEGVEIHEDAGWRDYEQNITEKLRKAVGNSTLLHAGDCTFAEAKSSYFSLWRKINGKASFESNPWVWVICFKPAPL